MSSSTRASFSCSARSSSVLVSTRSSSSCAVAGLFSLASLYFCSCSFRFFRSSVVSSVGVAIRSWSSFRRSGRLCSLSRSFCAFACASSRSLRSALLQTWSLVFSSSSACLSFSVVFFPLRSSLRTFFSSSRSCVSFRASRFCAFASLFALFLRSFALASFRRSRASLTRSVLFRPFVVRSSSRRLSVLLSSCAYPVRFTSPVSGFRFALIVACRAFPVVVRRVSCRWQSACVCSLFFIVFVGYDVKLRGFLRLLIPLLRVACFFLLSVLFLSFFLVFSTGSRVFPLTNG